MILWTLQSERVYRELLNKGYYICDSNKCRNDLFFNHYDWLVEQMITRIGLPVESVRALGLDERIAQSIKYPVWAWHTYSLQRKLDLRKVDRNFGEHNSGKSYYRIEIDVPDDLVVLSDFNAWSSILNNGILASNEEEWDKLYDKFHELSKKRVMSAYNGNWQRVFNINAVKNDWMSQGEYVQATFWILTNAMVRKVTVFKAL